MRSSATRLGEVLDDAYELEELVSSTGQLEIYRAKDRHTREAVRVQLLRPEFALHGSVVQSFLRAPRALSELTHDGLPRVRVGSDDTGIPFVVEELVEGRALSGLIASFPQGLPLALVSSLCLPLIDALALVHQHGMVHGRIDGERVKLLGATHAPVPKWVGFAALSDPQDDQDAVYRAPELGGGADALVTPQADVFAFGVLLYLMLSGELPFRSGKKGAVPLQEIAPHLPNALLALTGSCLEARPTKRLPHASAVLQELRACLQPKAAATNARAPEPTVPDAAIRGSATSARAGATRAALRGVPSAAPRASARAAAAPPAQSAPPRTIGAAFDPLADEPEADTGTSSKPKAHTTVRRKPSVDPAEKRPGITEEPSGFEASSPPPSDSPRARPSTPSGAPRAAVSAPPSAAARTAPGASRQPRTVADAPSIATSFAPRSPGAVRPTPSAVDASPNAVRSATRSPDTGRPARTAADGPRLNAASAPPRGPADAPLQSRPPRGRPNGPSPAAASWLASAVVTTPPSAASSSGNTPSRVTGASARERPGKRPGLTQGQVAAVALTEAQLETLRSLRANDEPDRDRLIGIFFLTLLFMLLHFAGPLIGEPNMATAQATFGPRLRIVASAFSIVAMIAAVRMWFAQIQNPSLIGRVNSFLMSALAAAIMLLTITLFTRSPLLSLAAGYARNGLPWGLGLFFTWFGFGLALQGARRLASNALLGVLTMLLAGGGFYGAFHAVRAGLQKDKHRITLPFVKHAIPTSIDEIKRQAADKSSLSNWQEQHQDIHSLQQRQNVGASEEDDMKPMQEIEDTRAKNKSALEHLGQTLPTPEQPQPEPSGTP